MCFGCHGNGNGSWLGLAVAAAGVEQAAWELALWQRGLPAADKTAGLPGRRRWERKKTLPQTPELMNSAGIRSGSTEQAVCLGAI